MLRSTFPFFSFLDSLKVYDEGEVHTGYVISCNLFSVFHAVIYLPSEYFPGSIL